jgi:hypothetical protein
MVWIVCSTAFVLLFTVLACRSADPVTQICEQDDRDCTMTCVQSPNSQLYPNYPYSSAAYQVASGCEQTCEVTYQRCLQRRENRAIRMISANQE